MKRFSRRCAICGEKVNIRIYEDGTYRGAEYYGKHKLPVGKGEWKDAGTSRLCGKKINLAKWTGKYKEFEHWECSKCYEEAMHECWLGEMIEKLFGERCKEYAKGCARCEAWFVHDSIIEELRKQG